MMTGKDQTIAFLRLLPGQSTVVHSKLHYALSPTDSLVIGRDFRCHIVLDPRNYRSVSRRHAEVKPVLEFETPGGGRFWQICDLGSSNGTFLNGKSLQGCRVLQAGDRIMLGHNGPEFVFEYYANHPLQAISPANPVAVQIPESELYPTAPSSVQTPAARPAKPDSVSLTQLFPIISTGRELARKAYLFPAAITIVFVVLLFLSIGNATAFNFFLAAYLAGAAYYFVYQLCGKEKFWWLLTIMALSTALLVISPVLDLFTFVFHRILPGNLPNDSQTNFLVVLVKMFFGAGLMEELLKAVPVLLVYWLGTRLRRPWREGVGVWEPLDGILLGAASAVGFSLMETLGVYIPATYKSTLVAGPEAAQLAGLQLLIPRVLGLVAGHMAYSGYLGYFIGLSALRRRQRKLILSVGYLTASGLHTLWNAAGLLSPVFLAGIGLVSYAFLGAAILKARALSPTRSQNFATRFHQ
jgi:RsiW-degrading membrane proteinase PrsW (M82 family)